MVDTKTTAKPSQGVRRPDLDTLYSVNPDGSHNTIHTADVKGRWQVRKKITWTVLMAIYVLLPWIQMNGRPAVLLDLPARQFYLFGAIFDASDANLMFFVVAGVALLLFVLSTLFGRVWCGFACPQTVFLDGMFRKIERLIDGSAAKRKALEEAGITRRRMPRLILKHACYLALSLALAHGLLAYFIPARDLFDVVLSGPTSYPFAFFFVLVLAGLVYGDMAWFREQFCIILCPYGRLQSVLYDADTVQVGYDAQRGEPRGRYNEEGRGSCIDCHRCVAVCPTGIDIRNGTQLECIGCSNCIDVCNEVMEKIGEEPGLVRYDSERGLSGGKRRFIRPRLFVYVAAIVIWFSLAVFMIGGRDAVAARAVRLDGPPYVIMQDNVRNLFRLHLVNKLGETTTFKISGVEMPSLSYVIPETEVTLKSPETRNLTVLIDVPKAEFKPGMTFRVRVEGGGETVEAEGYLVGPED